MFKLDLEKAEEQEIKLQHPWDHKESTGIPEKHLLCFIDYTKVCDCVDHNKLWKIFKRWVYQSTWPATWETYMQVKKQQL